MHSSGLPWQLIHVSSNPHTRSRSNEIERERELEVDDEHLEVFGAAYNVLLFCFIHPLIE
jgi:hypothetical protein